MSEKNGSPTQNVVQAVDIIEALTKEDGVAVYVLRDAQVVGKLDLKHRVVHTAVDIQRCTFLDPVDLRYCEFEQSVDFSGCTFHRRFNGGFRTVYKKDLTCHGVTFDAGMQFIASQVEGSTYFDGASFLSKEKGSSFIWTSFGPYFDCSNATFKGPTFFDGIRCERNGHFWDTQIENDRYPVSFTGASFGSILAYSNATFKGPANFDLLTCGGDGLFDSARFEIKKNAEDSDAVDYEDVAFNLSTFASTLDLSFATFARAVSLEQVSVQKALRLTGAHFEKNASLYNATIDRLIFEGGSPSFAEGAYLDLRECTFQRFQGDKDQAKEQARDLVKAQDPSLFSRDPYQQLERYYTSIGDEAEAKDIYFEGRQALRENAYQQNASTRWSRRQKFTDEILRLLTGYGVKIGRLFVIALIFLVLGTLVFYWPENALQTASGSTEAPAWQEGPLYRAAYSLDLFLPVVNLHVDENWEPNGPWLQAYAIGHATVGWLVVPLLLAALAGIIRR
jgi:hypothetical protein